jgi:hypothetical protein
MLTTGQIATALGELVYRPGWTMRVYESQFQGLYISFTMIEEDSYNPGERITLNIKSPVPPMVDKQAFREWLRWRLEGIACHEVHEWLRFRDSGKAVFDPHAEGVDEPAR